MQLELDVENMGGTKVLNRNDRQPERLYEPGEHELHHVGAQRRREAGYGGARGHAPAQQV